MMMNKDKLKMLKMPGKSAGVKEAEYDAEMLADTEMPEDEMMEKAEEGEAKPETGMLAEVSDEELLNEIKMRGLKLDNQEAKPKEEETEVV